MAMFSLLIGTLNRPLLLEQCLNSLTYQSLKDFEVIIVDQSDNNETNLVADKFRKNLDIKYKKVSFKGLSRARNEALKITSGKYFCLIDDDAYYDADYLKNIYSAVKSKDDNYIISGHIYDNVTKGEFCKYSKISNTDDLSVFDILCYCPSAALCFPFKVYNAIGYFDEKFGVGAQYSSGEETDFLLRAINYGFKICYMKEIRISHPILLKNNACFTSLKIRRIKRYKYSVGLGALIRKHFSNKTLFLFFIIKLLKIIINLIILNKNDAYYQLKGIFAGLLSYKKDNCDDSKDNTLLLVWWKKIATRVKTMHRVMEKIFSFIRDKRME